MEPAQRQDVMAEAKEMYLMTSWRRRCSLRVMDEEVDEEDRNETLSLESNGVRVDTIVLASLLALLSSSSSCSYRGWIGGSSLGKGDGNSSRGMRLQTVA